MIVMYDLVSQFRHAIDLSVRKACFQEDLCFKSFPRACCGDTCYLLAEYLLGYNIETVYVCGTHRGQSHAWLVLKDSRVHTPQKKLYSIPKDIAELLRQYGENVPQGEQIDISKYAEVDIKNGIILDITSDQFGEVPVYVGLSDVFHKKFKFDFAHDMNRLQDDRLKRLYEIIDQFL